MANFVETEQLVELVPNNSKGAVTWSFVQVHHSWLLCMSKVHLREVLPCEQMSWHGW